jgi:plasmid stability protein
MNVLLRGLSPDLHARLKAAASRSHRSLNGEILERLEASFAVEDVDPQALLERIRSRAARLHVPRMSTEDLQEMKESGRA